MAFQLVQAVLELLEEMVVTVCRGQNVPPSEVRSWRFARLLRNYKLVGRAMYEEYISTVQATEGGTLRAIAQAFGEKNMPSLPTFDDMQQDDPWEPPKAPKTLSPLAAAFASRELWTTEEPHDQ